MSRCLCCGKPLRTENADGWHSSCIKSFFGTSKMPDSDVSKELLYQLVDWSDILMYCKDEKIIRDKLENVGFDELPF